MSRRFNTRSLTKEEKNLYLRRARRMPTAKGDALNVCAIALKRDYWPAYAHLSDYYREKGDVAKARETLQTGLSHAPGAKGLERRLAELRSDAGRKTPGQANTTPK